MPFNNGENVGPYRVTEQLGRGGMATVYKAYHAKLDRYVALKVLHPAFLEDENFLARFQREARLVAKLEHPNIVPIYDFAEHDGQPYLVMKFVEGETLKALINRGRLSVEQIWKVVEAVGSGLGYAHQQGILHRDIKPSNVIVADDGQIYLADFGLARIAEMGESTLSGDMIMGTPQYISPEQAMGVKDLDARTDIYSFAVVLYEMVVGQVPFSADTPFSIIHDHIYSPLPLPKTVNPSVPEEVERVLLKALAKERDDRYQSVPELVQAFKDAWEESDVDMAEVTMTTPISPEVIRARTAPTPAPSASQAATVVQAEADALKADELEEEEKPKKSKRKKILLVLAALALICLCVFAIGIISDNQNKNVDNTAPIADLSENLAPIDGNTDGPIPADVEAELADLQSLVEETPDDPHAHLNYSLALFDSKKFDQAFEELNQALDLAGDDSSIYFDAGFPLMDREIWVGSTNVFMRALQNTPPDAPEQMEFTELYRESLYKSARATEMLIFLPYDEALALDEPSLRVAEARHEFLHGNVDQAQQMLASINDAFPGIPEARLLEAEMLSREKRPAEARPIFESLTNDENTPAWIFSIAEEALAKMPDRGKK